MKGEYGRAISDYSKAIELNPKFVWAYLQRAFTYESIGEYKKASSDFNKAIKLHPKGEYLKKQIKSVSGKRFTVLKNYSTPYTPYKETDAVRRAQEKRELQELLLKDRYYYKKSYEAIPQKKNI